MVGGVLAAIVDVARVGLPVMTLLIAGESMGVPLPGETALIAAAILAGRGQLDIVAVIALASFAAIVGDNVGYLIGRRGGRRLLLRQPRLRAHGERLLAYELGHSAERIIKTAGVVGAGGVVAGGLAALLWLRARRRRRRAALETSEPAARRAR